jgi:hypothetical protein
MSSIFPYTYNVTNTPVPLFPGAYIFRSISPGANGFIPIYTSIPNFTFNGMSDLLQDKDAEVLVLPGFTLNLYVDLNYANTVYSYDNSGGTDVLYRISTGVNTATSCKLFYKFPSGNAEVGV